MITLAQMKAALNAVHSNIKGVGAQEAPDMRPKTYISPVKGMNSDLPPGGVSTPSGLPIGGVDMSRMQPGQQMMPQMPQQPGQPQGGQMPGAPPQGGPEQAGQQAPSNILQMTQQGRAMAAMTPPQGPQPPQQGMADGGGVRPGRATMHDARRAVMDARRAQRVRPEIKQNYVPSGTTQPDYGYMQDILKAQPAPAPAQAPALNINQMAARLGVQPGEIQNIANLTNQGNVNQLLNQGAETPDYIKNLINRMQYSATAPSPGKGTYSSFYGYNPTTGAFTGDQPGGYSVQQGLTELYPGQQPQTMNKGGTPKIDWANNVRESGKPLVYRPAPPMSNAEIRAHAERMARQSAGLENPNNVTLQQLAREQNLPLDIRSKAKKINTPIIDWNQMKGAFSIGIPGDPSRGGLIPTKRMGVRFGEKIPRAGEVLHAIGDEELESPVPLFGGKDYGAYGGKNAWASDLGASAGLFNLAKDLAAAYPDSKILGQYHKMSPDSLNHAGHMLDAVLSYHQPHKAGPERIESLNNLMRNVRTTKSKQDRPYPEFPGFEKPDDVMLHGLMNADMRKKIINLLSTDKYFPGGKRKYDDLVFALSHPELRHIETGAGGSSILEIDPKRNLNEEISQHPTYGHDIPSKLIGKTRYITPLDILAPSSMANARNEIAQGKVAQPFGLAKMNLIRELIDDQYVNQMGQYEHEMKKILGYKKGGKAKNMDSMRLELTKRGKGK